MFDVSVTGDVSRFQQYIILVKFSLSAGPEHRTARTFEWTFVVGVRSLGHVTCQR